MAVTADELEAERRFLAYAAHELRGSIALQRTHAEVALADPDAGALRRMGERVVAACERQGRLVEALLTLARTESGPHRSEPVDLAAIVAECLRAHDLDGLAGTAALEPARTAGDPDLVERLVANLVANATRYNVPDGRIELSTSTASGRAVLTVANTGPEISTEELTELFRPFHRRPRQPRSSSDGVGLGLAIVRAIADAHDATVAARGRAGGGAEIVVAFPASRVAV